MLRRLFTFCLDPNAVGDFANKAEDFAHRFLADDIIRAGCETLKQLQDKKSDVPSKFFTNEDQNITLLTPYMLKFGISLFIENRAKWLTENNSYLPNLFSMAVGMILKFWNTTKENAIITKLLHSCIHLVFYMSEYLKEMNDNGILEKFVNEPLITKIVKQIDYEKADKPDNKSFSEKQKLLLEIYLGLIGLVQKASNDFGRLTWDSTLEITKGISIAKRGLQIIKEKDAFNFLPYFIHHKDLKDNEKNMLNQTYESNHNAFNVKTCGKFVIDQVERMTIKFSDKSDFKPLTWMGIATDAKGAGMHLYDKEEIKKNDGKKEFNMSHFYSFYPIVKQMAVTFGKERRDRTGMNKDAEEPTLVKSTKEDRPIQIFAEKNHSIMICEDGTVKQTGRCESSNSEYKEFKIGKDDKVKVKIAKISCGPSTALILTEDKKVYYKGNSNDFALPEDANKSEFTEFKLSQDPLFSDKIVDIAAGRNCNCFVTESGALYA